MLVTIGNAKPRPDDERLEKLKAMLFMGDSTSESCEVVRERLEIPSVTHAVREYCDAREHHLLECGCDYNGKCCLACYRELIRNKTPLDCEGNELYSCIVGRRLGECL